MTDTPILDQIKWPQRADEVSADALIKHSAMVSMVISRENDDRRRVALRLRREDPARKGALREWVQGLAGEVAEAQVAILLDEVQKLSRDAADELAKLLWRHTEDGGVLYELMFDLLDERGVDSEAMRNEIDAEADAEQEAGRG